MSEPLYIVDEKTKGAIVQMADIALKHTGLGGLNAINHVLGVLDKPVPDELNKLIMDTIGAPAQAPESVEIKQPEEDKAEAS